MLCASAFVLEFDKSGNLLKSWGGPGYVPDWPAQEHGIAVDKAGNVWLSGNSAETKDSPADRVILKFSNDGKSAGVDGDRNEQAEEASRRLGQTPQFQQF